MRNSILFSLLGLVLILALGCSVKNGLEIGPVSMILPMGSGTLDPAQFPDTPNQPIVIGRVHKELCDLPTEDQLTEVFRTCFAFDPGRCAT